ncbi:hypothetical protein FNB79_02640 [Formosa sediminum]|uniref:DUF6089 domain-containing protein n=1 Tax=Formosa sediminum TaxID=2594004 RepID=A0A516GN06_9FLAO|nr:DUF6089 family protein [Formosa sediminum]QDO92916.1 hypothetical protein FNB79_02640 [Formosa sediminum]
MKYILILVISLFCFHYCYSQTHEFGVFLGGSNLIGDVGEPSFLNPNQFAIGGVYKWNKSPRHSWRISGTITELQISTEEPTKTVGELSAGLEFNLFEYNLHQSGPKSTPYIYTGLSALNHVDADLKKKWALALPMILGYKFRFSRSFNIGLEIGARYAFADDLDGSDDLGNLNNNDWYVFTGITLTYTFGRNPCYCTN